MEVLNEIPDKLALDTLADESGVAIAIVDQAGREVSVSNNNSICRRLNPTGEFSSACAAFCGKALEKAFESGSGVGYECHAGLECRAIPIEKSDERFVAIIGRTFVKAEKYRRATERAISGDWSNFAPSEFFENILLTGSAELVDKAARKLESLVQKTSNRAPITVIAEPVDKPPAAVIVEPAVRSEPVTEPYSPKAESKEDTNIVDKFVSEIRGQEPVPAPVETAQPTPLPESVTGVEPAPAAGPGPDQPERRMAESRAWRSFFGSLLKTDYPKAVESILEFLAHHYGFTSLMWLERVDERFDNTASYGELKNRKVRLGIAPSDPRLMEASMSEKPFEIGERQKGKASARKMHLFPIGVGGEISAAIATIDPIEPESAKTQIARICQSVAPQLEILRLRSDAAHREVLARAVRRFSESIKTIDADDFWLNLTQNAAEMLQAERASLLVFDERSESLEIKALIGSKTKFDAAESVGVRVARIVFSRNEPVVISDVAKTGLPPAPAERNYKMPSFLSCPINIGGRTIAVMSFTDRAGGKAFDKASLNLFQAIAPQLAIAIDRSNLKEKAGEFEQLSVTDSLTGLLNRRYIEERLMEETKRSNRHGFPMSFMMLDVDHFKSYNDQFGHPAGDEALKLVGHVIRETLRGADVAARYGGEEFAILLPQTTADEAMTIAERIRDNVEHTNFANRRVTLSIGVASCSAELCSSANIVSAADKALYEAKRLGRNRVRAFEQMNGVQSEKVTR